MECAIALASPFPDPQGITPKVILEKTFSQSGLSNIPLITSKRIPSPIKRKNNRTIFCLKKKNYMQA